MMTSITGQLNFRKKKKKSAIFSANIWEPRWSKIVIMNLLQNTSTRRWVDREVFIIVRWMNFFCHLQTSVWGKKMESSVLFFTRQRKKRINYKRLLWEEKRLNDEMRVHIYLSMLGLDEHKFASKTIYEYNFALLFSFSFSVWYLSDTDYKQRMVVWKKQERKRGIWQIMRAYNLMSLWHSLCWLCSWESIQWFQLPAHELAVM
jgi:hypothetical protein